MTAQEIADGAERQELVIIDTQAPHAFAQAHVPGAYNLPFRRQGYAQAVTARLQGLDRPVAIFAEHDTIAQAAAAVVEAAGFQVAAVYGDGLCGWTAAGLALVQVADLTVDALHERLGDFRVVDVREPYEWRSGVVPGAVLLPLSELEQRVAELDKSQQYAIVCASGARSAGASAWLAEQGYRVANVVGGMALWMGGGHPTEPAL